LGQGIDIHEIDEEIWDRCVEELKSQALVIH